MTRVTNFGKNWSFTPGRLLRPGSAEELSEIVRSSRTLRVMGARHSWSRGIMSEDTAVTLDAMSGVVNVDVERRQVTVQAGMRLKEVVEELDRHGLAFDNLGSIAEQSVGGAITTGTHGTGRGHRCLADQVHSLSLIDGRGDERVIAREHPDFNAVAVGLGAFGVVHEVTLNVVPRYQMHAVTESLPFDEVIDRLDELLAAHDHFKLWWFVPNDTVVVFRQDHTDEARNDSDLKRWFKDEFLAVVVYRSLLAMQRVKRDRLVRWTNRVLVGAYAKTDDRICRSEVAFLTPTPPRHDETEWAFDLANAKTLLREYRRQMLDSGYTYNFVQEIRFTRGDPFWASPGYERDSIWLSMYNIDRAERWADQLARFETFACANAGRPHWGKVATFDSAYLREQLPRLGDFARLRGEYDPEGRFSNPWLQRVLGV